MDNLMRKNKFVVTLIARIRQNYSTILMNKDVPLSTRSNWLDNLSETNESIFGLLFACYAEGSESKTKFAIRLANCNKNLLDY